MSDDEGGHIMWALPAALGLAVFSKLVVCCDTRPAIEPWWYPRFPFFGLANMLGTFACGFLSAAMLKEFMGGCRYHPIQWKTNLQAALTVTLTLFFFGSEADRSQAIQDRGEALQLSKGFTSVRDADCSDPTDAENIKHETRCDMTLIDEAIMVLQAAGMSTCDLRLAAARGVNVTGAGFISFSNLCVSFGIWLTLQVSVLTLPVEDPGITIAWIIVSLLQLAIYVAFFLRAHRDQRAFAASVSAKVSVITLLALRFSLT
ncbi:unnamed protein product [Polarella glacialis]|uniref:Transmembrane protein n=1 Tax=Polarella glacialis TaxID=89957 RepID=A0A813E9N6_POLGL|nr:unnamed protein product [Polarella glacialis]